MAFRTLTSMLLLVSVIAVAQAADGPESTDFFERRIRPVLAKHCYECHSADSGKIGGSLLLDTREASRRGGDSGPAIVPGEPDSSLLLEAIRYEGYEMPPSGPLPKNVIADFEKWVKAGAIDPREGHAARITETTEADLSERAQHWSFHVPERTKPLNTVENGKTRSPIDALVRNRQREDGITFSKPADKRTLIRRAHFDLIGLPPSPDAVEDFVGDECPDAFERRVDRLIASPHFGERIGRMWLDVARYGEDQAHVVGNNLSLCYPNAYMYRDWVIEAFNNDLPYDEFITRQLATDLIDPDNDEQLVALGFMGVGPKYYRRNSPQVMADEWEDRVDTVTRGLMGVTVACARCHDHKFDPFSTEDYYGIAGVFANVEMFNRPIPGAGEVDKKTKAPVNAMHVIRDTSKPRDLNVMIRGDVENLGAIVPRRFPKALLSGEEAPLRDGSGRANLAAAISDPRNPLTARVIVNRVWSQLFGTGLVKTTSNFGILGEKPVLPAVLDTLAADFIAGQWSVKKLHRDLVLSSTWQQSSRSDASNVAIDPENRFHWRMPRRRLSIEQWRDSMLASAGQLDESIGGRSIDPRDATARRRTIYSEVSRLELNSMLAMFDFPDPNTHAGTRNETTTPLQKLFVLNSPFVVSVTDQLQQRVSEQEDAEARINHAYKLLFGREPTAAELGLGLSYVLGEPEDGWTAYTQALLASNEMMYLD